MSACSLQVYECLDPERQHRNALRRNRVRRSAVDAVDAGSASLDFWVSNEFYWAIHWGAIPKLFLFKPMPWAKTSPGPRNSEDAGCQICQDFASNLPILPTNGNDMSKEISFWPISASQLLYIYLGAATVTGIPKEFGECTTQWADKVNVVGPTVRKIVWHRPRRDRYQKAQVVCLIH